MKRECQGPPLEFTQSILVINLTGLALELCKAVHCQYNVEVWFIGKIHPDSEYQLTADYNDVHPPMPRRGLPTAFSTPSYTSAGSAYGNTGLPDVTTSTYEDEAVYHSNHATSSIYPRSPVTSYVNASHKWSDQIIQPAYEPDDTCDTCDTCDTDNDEPKGFPRH
jgi:hypothetical protein